MPPQHLQPEPWPEVAENRLARAGSPCRAATVRVDIAGKFNKARGESTPQLGQVVGNSYSAIGRKSENEPQFGQSYSYFGISFLIQTDDRVSYRDGDRCARIRGAATLSPSRPPLLHPRLAARTGKDALSDAGVDAPVAVDDLGDAEIDPDRH